MPGGGSNLRVEALAFTRLAGGLTAVHVSVCLIIVYPPTITCTQGLTLVHFSAQRNHFFWWDKLVGVGVGISLTKR